MKGLKPGDHVCWLFDDENTHERLSTEFIVDGFNKNNMILCIVTGSESDPSRLTQEKIGALLQGYGVDVESALASGQLECVFDKDLDDLDDIQELFTSKTKRAAACGFNSIRASIDYCSSSSLLAKQGQPISESVTNSKLFKLEAQLTQLCKELSIIVLCSYNRKRFSDTVLFKQICTHPKAAINTGPSTSNVYYVPPDKLLANDTREMYTHSVANFVEYHNKDAKLSQQLSELMEKNIQLQKQLDEATSPRTTSPRTTSQSSSPSSISTSSQREDASTNTPPRLISSGSVAEISHELRSPLNGIVASASLLASSVTPEQRVLVDTIELSSSQLLQVLTDMIDLHIEPRTPPSQNSTSITPPSSSSSARSSPILIPSTNTSPSGTSTSSGSFSSVSPLTSPRGPIVSSGALLLPDFFPKKLEILVVEDNAINQTVLKKMIHRLGYQPHVVCDGEAAVELCRTVNYDVIFMDIFLPNIDGLTATKMINAIFEENKNRPKPVIVAVTASVTQDIRHQCTEVLGMAAFVTKPVRMDAFTNVFAEAIIPRLSSR